jgi:phage tail-like protein
MSVTPYDPYKTFRFQLSEGNVRFAGLKNVGEIKRTTGVNKYRDSTGIEIKTPGNTDISSLVLQRGITQSKQFIEWADLTYSSADPHEKPGYKKDLTLELLDNQGQVVYRYFLHNCWVSEFTTLPALDSESNTIAIEQIKLELEGYTRDTSLIVSP